MGRRRKEGEKISAKRKEKGGGPAGETEIVLSRWGPNPKQRQFLEATERYVCYGGARGGGKTWAVIAKAVLLSLRYPGIRILVMRRRYTQLEEMLAAPMRRMVPPEEGKYSASARTLLFSNGSSVRFGNLAGRRSVEDYQGREYDVIFIDEATQFTEEEFRALGACVRGVNDFPKRFYLTCNPGGIGHQWVKRLFVSRAFRRDPERPEKDENPEDYRFIPATVFDNRVMLERSPDYLKQLDALPESIRRAHRDGDWDALSGQYFSEFRMEKHTAEPFRIPPEWTRYRAVDYGLDMFACVWGAVDPEGRAWVYREFQRPGLVVSEAAAAMLERTAPEEEITATIAPPDLWSRQKDTGRSMAELFAGGGAPLVRGDSGRVRGWLLLRELLRPDGDGKPGLIIFRDCPRLIENLRALQTDERNPNDCAGEPHEITHLCDALRYFASFRKPEAGRKEAAGPEEEGTDYGGYMTGGEADESYLDFTT